MPARVVAALTIAVFVSACGRHRPLTAATDHAVSFLALGDSYTIGQSVAPDDGWPEQLAARLRGRGVDAGEAAVIARTGWTSSDLSAAIDDADPRGPFGLVGLLIGVNDQFKGDSADAYRPRFEALLTRAIGFAGGRPGHVIVLSIPDWGVMPFADGRDRAAIARRINEFNAVDRDACARRGVLFVDVTPVSRQAATRPAFGASDGLHPSGEQYAEWAALADAALRSAGQ